MSGPADWCCADPELCIHDVFAKPAATVPKHRADVPVDSCSDYRHGPCPLCAVWPALAGTHRAEPTS